MQREVQRKLGRCLLRLQQYERMMKAFHVEHRIEGPPRQLALIKQRRMDAVQKKTLGQVISELTENGFIRLSDAAQSSRTDDSEDAVDPSHFSHRFSIRLSAGGYEHLTTKLSELVTLRNELIHHFIEKFDVWTEPGGVAADSYLDARYQTIDEAYKELCGWAKVVIDAREEFKEFVSGPDFREYLEHGIHPDGSGVDWPFSTIVKLLQSAESELAYNGWTPLNDAIALIRAREPDQTPKRYGCASWRQVLHESRLFAVRREKAGNSDGPSRVFYRSLDA